MIWFNETSKYKNKMKAKIKMIFISKSYWLLLLCYIYIEYLNNNVRDYTDVETPCSIPNQEAKHIVGDDTTPYWQGESSSLRTC